jgi:pyrroloquinoline quinone biosynthesis protein D
MTVDQPLDLAARPVLASKVRLQTDRVSNEPVLLFPEGVVQLNATSRAIVQYCDGHHTIQEIVEELAKSYHISTVEVQEDVEEFLRALYNNSLLEFRS